MGKKEMQCFSEWQCHKSNFPFNISLHEIKECYEKHRHCFLEFFLVIEGSGTEIVNGIAHSIKPGSFTLLLPYQVHEFHVDQGEIIRLFNCNMSLDVFFGNNKIGEDLNMILFNSESALTPFVHFNGDTADRVLRIFTEMKIEYDLLSPWSSLMFKSKIVEILILFDRTRRSALIMEGNESIKSNHSNIWEIAYFLFNHYHENISLSTLSRHFFINSCYLSAQFKKYFGKSFKSFFGEIRILHACRLIASTDLPISEIAFTVGFNSYSSFCRVFYQNKRLSATEYKKMVRRNSSG